jgi:hypothetical protein
LVEESLSKDEIFDQLSKKKTPTEHESSRQSVASHTAKVASKSAKVASHIATQNVVASHISEVASHKRKDRHKPGRVQLNSRISPQIKLKIEDFCKITGLAIQEFLELVASHYFDCVASHSREKWLAHDDLMIFKTDDSIRALYFKFSGNRQWKLADDRVGQEYNGADRARMEIGMIQTALNFRGKRINSFAYFKPMVDDWLVAELKSESVDAILRIHRKKWNQRVEGADKR